MGARLSLMLRVPFILLTMVNLAILGVRLWPWPEVLDLPLNGATGIDPAVCLMAYIVFFFFIADSCDQAVLKPLSAGTLLGLLAGVLLVVRVLLVARSADQPVAVLMGLLVAAGIIWGVAGLRGARLGGNGVMGMIAALWSGMVSGLLACTAVLATINLEAPKPVTQDAWKQYEGLAIGNPAIQSLVHSLNSATGFLLICPLVGAVVGLIFAMLSQPAKS